MYKLLADPRPKFCRPLVLSLILILGGSTAPTVHAQARGGHVMGGRAMGGRVPTHIDGRFGHGHSYYDHGYALRGSPQGGYSVHHGRETLSYDRNHWYRRDHGRSIIIGAPFGAFVPFLPWYYSTIWWDGLPYYYANDTYYTWNDQEDQYQVVEPPAGIEAAASDLAPAIGDLFVYPKNGQTDDQKLHDEADCHAAAVKEIGFDPTIADDNASSASASDRRALYRKSLGTCLESRGYSVD
jgi:hypothetical protein